MRKEVMGLEISNSKVKEEVNTINRKWDQERDEIEVEVRRMKDTN